MPKNSLKLKENSSISYIKSNYGVYLKGDLSPLPLLKSLIRNSVKEFKKDNNYNKIAIILDSVNGSISVIDNGSGFISDYTKALSKEHFIEVLNRDIDKNRIVINLQITCYLSSKLIVSTINNGNNISYTYENGVVTREISPITTKAYSTKITFFPDKRLFNSTININELTEYLCSTKKQNNGIMIAVVNDGHKVIINCDKKIRKSRKPRKTVIDNIKEKKFEEVKKPKKSNKNGNDDKWDVHGKSFIETIYVDHIGDKCNSIGNVAIVYGKNDDELSKRSKLVSSVPDLIDTVKSSVNVIEKLLNSCTSKNSKEYKNGMSLLSKIEKKYKDII